MFEVKEKKDNKVTVRFTNSEIKAMEAYIEKNKYKNLAELIRASVGEKIKV